jgi:hypothetical protein
MLPRVTKVDQFESAFKAAARTPYEHEAVNVGSVLVLTDLEQEAADAWGERVKRFLGVLEGRQVGITWKVATGDSFDSVRTLLDLVTTEAPDLVVTYRSLHSQAWPYTYTLGRYVDVLAQELPIPVLLLPNPHAEARAEPPPTAFEERGTQTVMALTDHLVGDHRLVQWSAHLTAKGGTLALTHVEDGRAFDRYLDAIGKIPAIDTETARETIRAQLLKEPRDFIRSCASGLENAGLPLTIEERVLMGHRLREVRRLVDQQEIGLLVLHTKDSDQLAMHGLAYPLVVELRLVPILML